MNKIIGGGLVIAEVFGRYFLTAFILITLAIVGGLAVQGGDVMQTENPDMFNEVGGWELIYFFFDAYMIMIIVLPLMIFFFGRERQIYNSTKTLYQKIRDRK